MRLERNLFLGVVAGLLALSFGCGPGFDAMSGKDGLRGDAPNAELDQYIDDRVSASGGDHSDWRALDMAQNARLTVEIWWDNPEVEASLLLRSRRAGSAQKLVHRHGVRHETLGPIDVTEGAWYLRVQAQTGSSSYTLRIVTGESSGGGSLPDF